MLCDRCGKGRAEVFVVKIYNGSRHEEHLCRECAREMLPPEEELDMAPDTGMRDKGLYELQRALADLFSNVLTDRLTVSDERCPYCGGVMHDGAHTYGREIRRRTRPVKPMSELERLNADMDKAVQEENYEYAAALRDRIAEIRANEHTEEHE